MLKYLEPGTVTGDCHGAAGTTRRGDRSAAAWPGSPPAAARDAQLASGASGGIANRHYPALAEDA